MSELPLQVLGLVMVGFSGHSIFPTLRNDMKDKTQYPKMVGVVYVCSTAVHPEPYTLHPYPNPKLESRNPIYLTQTPNPEPRTPDPEPRTPNPEP